MQINFLTLGHRQREIWRRDMLVHMVMWMGWDAVLVFAFGSSFEYLRIKFITRPQLQLMD